MSNGCSEGHNDCDGSSCHGSWLDDAEHAGCFPGDTKILTPMGELRLDSLKVGNLVLSYSESDGSLIPRRIKTVREFRAAPIVHVFFNSDHAPLRVTARHSVLTNSGWKRVRKIKSGDRLTLGSGCTNAAEVAAVKRSTTACPVLNLITEGEHTFIADGVVAHNFTVMRRSRTLIHQIIEHLTDPATRLLAQSLIGRLLLRS